MLPSNKIRNWCVLTIKGGRHWVTEEKKRYLTERAEMGEMVNVGGVAFAVHQIAEIVSFAEYQIRFPDEFRPKLKPFEVDEVKATTPEERRSAFREMANGFRNYFGNRQMGEWQTKMLAKMERYATMPNPPEPAPSAVMEEITV